MYISNSIIKIQAHWRGYLSRNAFYEILIKHPPSHINLKKKLMGYRFSRISKKMRHNIHNQNKKVDRIIEGIEKNIEENEQIFEYILIFNKFKCLCFQ